MYEPENFMIEEDNHEDDLFSPLTKCHCFILQVMLHRFMEGGDQNTNNNSQNKAFTIMFKLIIKLLGCHVPHNVHQSSCLSSEWMTEFLTQNGRQDCILSKSELINLDISASMVWRFC